MIRKNLMKYHYLKKEIFTYSHLNMENTIDADYAHAERICKDFETKNLVEYHDLRVYSNTLLLGDVFENFRDMNILKL